MPSDRTTLAFTDGVTPLVDVAGFPWIAIYLKGDGGAISAGVVTVQTTDWYPSPASPPPEAAWVNTSITLNASGATLGGTVQAQLPVGAYSQIRLKLTTPITGAGVVRGVVACNGA